MKTLFKFACLLVATFALGNCTYVQPTSGENSSSTTTTTTEHDGFGNSVTTEETTNYR